MSASIRSELDVGLDLVLARGRPRFDLVQRSASSLFVPKFGFVAASVERNPTPRCNRRPSRGVQDQADFSESLCHLSCFSPPGSRLNANRWAASSALIQDV